MKFIRKNGRIIPIRERRKEQLAGGAEVAAGLAVGAGGGAATGAAVKRAQKMAGDAKNQYRIAQANFRAATGMNIKAATQAHPQLAAQAAKQITKAITKRSNAKMIFRARNPILHASAAAAALLIGHGVNKVSAAMNGGHEEGHKSKVAGAAAAGLTYAAYYRGLGFKNPLQIAANVTARLKGMRRPFKKYGPGGGI